MQSLTEKVLHLAPPGGLFDETVISNLFPESSSGARALLVHRAIQSSEILRLKPGLFVLNAPYRKSEPHPYILAASLHSPSHISLQSALAYHGLIPEAVYQVSSVTLSRSRQFSTPLGVFTFQTVKTRLPRAGVEALEISRNAWAFIATPLRAIADLLYLQKEITWKKDGLAFLTESLRIETDDLKEISFDTFDDILESFRSQRVIAFLKGLKNYAG
jgi:hypothetical protein